MTSHMEAARHEAGHALVIVEFDLWEPGWRAMLARERKSGPLGSVVPAGREFGDPDPDVPSRVTRFRGQLDSITRTIAARYGCMFLAGVAAQYPETWDWSPAHTEATRTDRSHANTEFYGLGYWPPDPWLTCWWASIELVDRRWAAIESIASALAAHGELPDVEVERIVESTPTRRNPSRPQAPVWRQADPIEMVAEQLLAWRTPERAQEVRAAAIDAAPEDS